MGITLESRELWKGRGRPARRASDNALATCRATARTKQLARRDLTPEVSERDVRELLADLRAAERELGGKVHIQRQEDCVLWYWTPARGVEP